MSKISRLQAALDAAVRGVGPMPSSQLAGTHRCAGCGGAKTTAYKARVPSIAKQLAGARKVLTGAGPTPGRQSGGWQVIAATTAGRSVRGLPTAGRLSDVSDLPPDRVMRIGVPSSLIQLPVAVVGADSHKTPLRLGPGPETELWLISAGRGVVQPIAVDPLCRLITAGR